MNQQPDRLPSDGPIAVDRGPNETVNIRVTHNGEELAVVMSMFNAWRVFACLAMILGVQLPGKILKAIRM